jgi:hypothetical protein
VYRNNLSCDLTTFTGRGGGDFALLYPSSRKGTQVAKFNENIVACGPSVEKRCRKTVAVVGKYRTGKSLLLNFIAQSDAFSVSHFTEGCTKGAWVFETRDGVRLLDFEGLGDLDQKDNAPIQLLATAILASEVLVLNITGVLQEDDITTLGCVLIMLALFCYSWIGYQACVPSFAVGTVLELASEERAHCGHSQL